MTEEKQERPTISASMPRPQNEEEFGAVVRMLADKEDPQVRLVGLSLLLRCLPMQVHPVDLAMCAQMLSELARMFAGSAAESILEVAVTEGCVADHAPVDENLN